MQVGSFKPSRFTILNIQIGLSVGNVHIIPNKVQIRENATRVNNLRELPKIVRYLMTIRLSVFSSSIFLLFDSHNFDLKRN